MWWIGNAWEKFDTVVSLFSVQKMRCTQKNASVIRMHKILINVNITIGKSNIYIRYSMFVGKRSSHKKCI